jgi:hypothetical protein
MIVLLSGGDITNALYLRPVGNAIFTIVMDFISDK